MKEFNVYFEKTFTYCISVMAEDKEEASIKADKRLIEALNPLDEAQEGYWEQTTIDEVQE